MKKIELGQTIGILANIGVIAGIVFLGYELRQNTSVALATASQNMANAESQLLEQLFDYPEVIFLFSKPELTDEEVVRLYAFLVVWARTYESHWSQYQAGVVDEETLLRYEGAFITGLSFPRNRNWWRGSSNGFDQRFRARIDERLEATDLISISGQDLFRSYFADPAAQ
jgi:hypothetical protein